MYTIITTHKNPDFDGFAAAYAAKFLYDKSIIVIEGEAAKNLADFLNIYDLEYLKEKDFKSNFSNQIKNNDFKKVVVVDTADINRIPQSVKNLIESGIEVDIYDHHPVMREKNINGNDFSVETGSATTLIVDKLLRETIDLPDVYETMFLIAIHEDTGNFVYSTTTPLDHKVAAELIERGAKIEEVEEFVSLEMTEEQKGLFDTLYNNIIELFVNEIEVYIAYAEVDKFIGGLNVITHKIFETLTPNILFSVVKMGKNIYIVSRSKTNQIDLNKLLEEFGGGGHKKAGSAKVKDSSLHQVVQKLAKTLRTSFVPVLQAHNIMSSPVRTTFVEEKIDKVFEIMDQTGHSGLPVIDKNRLVGIITKKDIEKAKKHNLGNAPVKAIMSENLKIVEIDTNITQIRKLMAEYDIGRIPVLKNDVLVGIVTRSDILRIAHGSGEYNINPIIKENYDVFNVRYLMEKHISKKNMNLLRLLGSYGAEKNMPVYVVGGFVRDLIMEVKNEDIDIVVEGDAIEFGKYVSEQLLIKVLFHKQFNTCSLFMKDGFRIDVATARTEYYLAPAELPKVEISTIKKDLYRRDFSINAMAIKLNPESFGNLLDFFGCKKDLENKIIKVLYSLSFVEDPTRILRAVRFEQRYGFKIEDTTIKYLQEAVEGQYLEKVTGPRIREEIEKILKETNPLKSIRRLGEFKIISHIFPYSYYTPTLDKDIETMFEFYNFLKFNMPEYVRKMREIHILTYILLQHTPVDSLVFIEFRYGFPKKFFEKLQISKKAVSKLNNYKIEKNKNIKLSNFYEQTKNFNNEQLIFTYVKLSDTIKKDYLEYLKKIKDLKLKISGKDLMEHGYKGKEISEKIEEITKDILDERIKAGEELELIRRKN
jgi:tRNA nucleotidyltransferase (CCA-adding enzyme)